MSLRINQNIAAMNAYRNLSVTDSQMSKSLEKLSSGFRINRAADDAAGLSISEGLRSQIGGLQQAVRNAQDGVNVVQTADGALTEVHSILQRMRDLAVQAANSGSQDTNARQAAQTEFTQLNKELDRIGSTTSFGGQKLLDGTFGGSSATVAGALTGVKTDPTGTGTNFGTMQLDLNGSKIDGVSISASTLTAALTGNSLKSDGTALSSGYYNNANDVQKDLQSSVDTALTTAVGSGYKAGDVQVAVTDAGNGVFKVALTSKNVGDKLSVAGKAAGDFGFGTTASTATVAAGAGGTFQVGANNTTADRIQVSIGKIDSQALATGSLDLVNSAGAAIDSIDTAIKSVSTERANLGAYQNRFEHTINNLNVAVQNLSASESQIRDTDMAQEMTQFTRAQILSQAGTAMLAQANQAPQSVLKLLG